MAGNRQLSIRLTVEDYAVVQRALVTLGETGDRALKRISDSADRAVPAVRQSGQAIQQVGYQVQDIFVQLQGGQNPFLILSQQGGQLAQALLGPKAALAATGALIAVATTNALLFADATEEAAEAQKKLAEALESANKFLLTEADQKFLATAKAKNDALEKLQDRAEKLGREYYNLQRAAIAAEQAFSLPEIGGEFGQAGGEANRGSLNKTIADAENLKRQLIEIEEKIAAINSGRLPADEQLKDYQERFGALVKIGEEVEKQADQDRKFRAERDTGWAEENKRAKERIENAEKLKKAALEQLVREGEMLDRESQRHKATGVGTQMENARAAAANTATAAIQDQVDALQQEQGLLGLNARAREQQIALLKAEEAARRGGIAVTDEQAEAIRREAGALYDLREIEEQSRRAAELAMEPWKNAIQGVQGAIAGGIEDLLLGTVTDAGQALKRIAARWAAEMATLAIFRPVMDSMLGLGGLGGGAFGAGLLGSAGVSPGFIGPLQAGQSYAGGGGIGGLGSLLGLTGQSGFLGGGLQTLVGGAGLGFAAPQILRQLGLGIGKGSPVGSGIGSIGGALLGNFLLPGIGGFIGGAAGGFLGDIVGGLFGGGGGMSQEEYYQNVNYYNDQFQKTQARAAFNPTIGQYQDRAYGPAGGGSAYKQALAQAEQDYQQLTAKMTELGYDASNFANVAQAYAKIVERIGTQFRDGMNRELDLALGQATGNMTAAFDDMVRTQGERRDEIKEAGADIVKAEQVFAAERLSFLQQLTRAQRDMIRATLSEADLALADLADQGMTVGDGLIAAGQAMAVLGENLADFLKGLQLSDLSPLAAGAKYGQARDTFEKTIAAARQGDTEAIARVQSDLQVFLTASRGMFASGDQYSQDYAMATGLAAALGADAPGLASGLGQAGIGLNSALLKSAGAMSDGRVTGAEATPLLAELAALRAELVGLTGPASDAVKQVEDLSQQIEAMREATAQLPSYDPSSVVPLSPSNDNANLPGWQQGALAGGPSQSFKDGLMNEIYPGLTYDQAPEAARAAVDQLFAGDPKNYLMMGGDRAAGTLVNTGLYSATDLYERFGINGLTGFSAGGAGTNFAVGSYIAEQTFGDQGGVGGPGSGGSVGGGIAGAAAAASNMSFNDAVTAVNDALSEIGMAVMGFQDTIGAHAIGTAIGGIRGMNQTPTTMADLMGMVSSIADYVSNEGLPGLSAVSQALANVLNETLSQISTIQDPKVDIQAIQSLRGMISMIGSGTAGGASQGGIGATGNPGPGNTSSAADSVAADHGGHFAMGGWVTGGVQGRDSVRAWLTPREFVMPVAPAADYAPELEAMRAGTYRRSGDDGAALLAEVRALRQEVSMLRAERREADNDAGQQRQAIVNAARGRAAARRTP